MNKILKEGYNLRSPQSAGDFEKYYRLRWEVLRAPWNQPLGSEKDELDESCFHLMIVNADHKVIACGRLQLNNSEQVQIRYMAVDQEERGKHLGAILIEGLEEEARKLGAKTIFLQAREGAIPFYLNCGYEIIEKTFLLYGEIQHFSMFKSLT